MYSQTIVIHLYQYWASPDGDVYDEKLVGIYQCRVDADEALEKARSAWAFHTDNGMTDFYLEEQLI